MKKLLILVALASTVVFAGCDRKETVVVPTTDTPAAVPVPGPKGEAGAPGAPGASGSATVVTPPAATTPDTSAAPATPATSTPSDTPK